MSSKKKTSNTLGILSVLAWILFAGTAVWFVIVFHSFDMFPNTWVLILVTVLLLLALLTGWVVYSRNSGKSSKILASIVNVLLAICLTIGSLYLPSIRSKIEKVFTDIGDSEVLSINYYVLTDEYKDAHPEVFDPEYIAAHTETENPEVTPEGTEETQEVSEETTSGETQEEEPKEETPKRVNNPDDYPEELREIIQHIDSTFLVQKNIDLENQSFAMNQLKELYEEENIKTKEFDSLWDAYDALLANEGEVFVMNSNYEELFMDVEGYGDFKKNTKLIFTVNKEIEKPVFPEPVAGSDSFSILIAGNDTYGGISVYGRTDVVMIATVNTKTRQVALISFPRDSYVPNPAYGYRNDKLTHLGVSGIWNTAEGLSNYTGVPIDFYAMTNFSAFVKIIDTLGGIDIYNPYSFTTNNAANTWSGTFWEGDLHLDGTMALAYCRERFNLPNGDFGRAEHENIVMRAIMDKAMSPAILTNFMALLDSLSGMVVTNFPTDSMFDMVKMQLNNMAAWNIESKSLKGSTGGASCAAAGGEVLSCVFLYDDEINGAIELMNKVINGEILE